MRLESQQVALLERLIGAASLRQKVLAGNVSNQNTPGYARREVEFERLGDVLLMRQESDAGVERHPLQGDVVSGHDGLEPTLDRRG